MTEFADCYWSSRDGLSLHYRDYPGGDGRGDGRPPVICLHGLTRNARDFAHLAERLSGAWRVICPEMRGRGDSDYAKDPATYNVPQYVEDVSALLDEAGIGRFVVVGTSLGGLMTMVMAPSMADRIAGAVLNDVGPWLEPEGLERIRGYVGQGRSFPTWMHAARAMEEANGQVYPDFQISDWLDFAKRIMTVSSNGRILFDYDTRIAEPFAELDVNNQPDLWPGLEALAGKPVLMMRGALSDLLSAATLSEMARRLPQAEAVTIERVGHAPTLDEPEAVAAVDRLLGRIA